MSKQIITMCVGIGTLIASLLYKYYNYYKYTININTNQKMDILLNRIHKLEDLVLSLQQSIEDIEDRIDRKNSQVIETNTLLTNKLDDFINLSYDVYE